MAAASCIEVKIKMNVYNFLLGTNKVSAVGREVAVIEKCL